MDTGNIKNKPAWETAPEKPGELKIGKAKKSAGGLGAVLSSQQHVFREMGVVRGVKVQHPCGDPKLPDEADRELSLRIVMTALRAVQTPVTGPTLFEPSESASQEPVHAA